MSFKKRLEATDLQRLIDIFKNTPVYQELFDKIPDQIFILNTYRQIVFANKEVLKVFGIEDKNQIFGSRPGEFLSCMHSTQTEFGCGNSDSCQYCGAFQSIIESLDGRESSKECKILTKSAKEVYDLRITSSPFKIEQDEFVIYSMADISNEKRREVLERLFFHDILNTASGISSLAQLLEMDLPPEYDEYKSLSTQLSSRLIDEITAQKQLLAAEKGVIELDRIEISSLEFLNEMINANSHYDFAKESEVQVDEEVQNFTFVSDKTILGRVVTNLLKNALEAEIPQGIVKIGMKKLENTISLTVNNKKVMPQEVKSQVFKRSFSTKGKGRGIGTYSVKLFTEEYLDGTASFTSNDKTGTTFLITIPND